MTRKTKLFDDVFSVLIYGPLMLIGITVGSYAVGALVKWATGLEWAGAVSAIATFCGVIWLLVSNDRVAVTLRRWLRIK